MSSRPVQTPSPAIENFLATVLMSVLSVASHRRRK